MMKTTNNHEDRVLSHMMHALDASLVAGFVVGLLLGLLFGWLLFGLTPIL